MIKLNLGCGGRPIKGFINVDFDNLKKMKKRYPDAKIQKGIIIKNFNIFKLPYKSETVDLVRADSLIEHLSFSEEKKFFLEVKRVLKKGGICNISTPDFEKTVRLWLKLKDDWQDFYKNDSDSIKKVHWFGTYTYKPINRWGYITATLFGSQNGKGQFHKNCYTKKKLKSIFHRMGFKCTSIKNFKWLKERDFMIRVIAKKI